MYSYKKLIQLRLYTISGLGADRRVFQYLDLNYEIIHLDWVPIKKNESIESYAWRLSQKINSTIDFGLVGLSFGGLIATEISKILQPKITILISSIETKNELRPIYRWIGKTGLMKLIPHQLFNPPRLLAYYLFGTQHKTLLTKILDDTDLVFAKWALQELLTWKNQTKVKTVLKISGTHDKLLPPCRDKNTILIQKGEHFMIVDRAQEINQIIQGKINSL